MKKEKIYIILMNTNTIPSLIVKIFSGYKYSHVVLSLDETYKKFYSFGRKNIFNFLDGGLVTYGIDSLFFKKFKNTKCLIYKMEIEKSKFNNLRKILKEYEKNSDYYKYDIKGLIIRYFYNSNKKRENYYVCSEFVATVLQKAGIWHFSKPLVMIRPKDFNKIKGLIKVYEGKLLNLSRKEVGL